MTGTIGALAPWLATAFVTLDQRAAQDRLEWGQLALEDLTASSQDGSGLVFLHLYQTTYLIGLILLEEIHFSTFLFGNGQLFQQGGQLEKQFCIESPRWKIRGVRRRIGPVGPFPRNAEAAAIQLPQ